MLKNKASIKETLESKTAKQLKEHCDYLMKVISTIGMNIEKGHYTEKDIHDFLEYIRTIIEEINNRFQNKNDNLK